MVLSTGSEAAGDMNKSALHMAATMTATVLQQPNRDNKVPDINVEDHSTEHSHQV